MVHVDPSLALPKVCRSLEQALQLENQCSALDQFSEINDDPQLQQTDTAGGPDGIFCRGIVQ